MPRVNIAITTTADQKGAQQTVTSLQQVGKAASASDKQLLHTASALARLQSAQGDAAGAAQTLTAALRQVDRTSLDAIRTETQLQQAFNAVDRSARGAAGGAAVLPRTIAGLSHEAASFAKGMIGVGTAIAVVQGTLESFGEAFTFQANLTATQNAINAQVGGLRAVGPMWAEAAAFAEKYNLTQQETAQILQNSTDILRTSTSSVSQLEEALLRLQSRDPSQPLSEAARALRELSSGDTQTIKEVFNVTANEANRMKAEIQAGGDAVQVLTGYLDRAGVGMDLLAQRTEGATGRMLELKRAQEDLMRAQATLAEGPGVNVISAQAEGYRELAAMLGGGGGVNEALKNNFAILQANAGAYVAYSATLLQTRDFELALGNAARARGEIFREAAGVTEQGTSALSVFAGAVAFARQQVMLASQEHDKYTHSLAGQIEKDQQAALATQELKQFQADLAAISVQVRAGHLVAADGAAQLAAQYGMATGEALRLINAQMQLATVSSGAARAIARVSSASARPITGAAGGIAGGIRGGIPRSARAAVASVGGGRGGGGGAARVSEEQKAADKIAEINERLADRLADIDKRAAEQRAAAARQFAASIAQTSADLIAQQEADDLDLVRAKDDQAQQLINRERAQATARIANEQAVAEARRIAVEGDAETAQKVLDIRQDQISKQQALDEHYLERQQELAGDDEAQRLLTEQYAQATARIAEAADTRISLAQQAAQQAAAAAQEERNAVVAAAEEEKAKVVGAAQTQQQAVTSSLSAQASAAHSWASSVSSAASSVVASAKRASDAIRSIPSMPSGGVTPRDRGEGVENRARGGSTNVGRWTLVGEQGPELVVFSAPGRVFSAARTRSMLGAPHMQAGGNILPAPEDVASLIETGLAGGGTAAGGGGRRGARGGGGGSAGNLKDALDRAKAAVEFLQAMAELRERLGHPLPPIDPALVKALADDAQQATTIIGTQIVPATKDQAENAKRYFDLSGGAIDILSAASDLRETLSAPQPPISRDYVQSLADDIRTVGDIIGRQLVPLTEYAVDVAKNYADSVGAAVDTLTAIADLGDALKEPRPPISVSYVTELARDIRIAGDIVGRQLVPLSDDATNNAQNYADSVGAAVDTLVAIADLREKLGKPTPPLNIAYVQELARQSLIAGDIVGRTIVPLSDQAVDNANNYADSVAAAVSVLKDVADLRESLGAPQPPLSLAFVRRLAANAVSITNIMRASLVPTSEEQADAVSRYADAVGSSVSALKDVLSLSSEMFTDYHSPSDAQIRVVANDARRIARTFLAAAATMSTEGIEAGQAYADAVGATFSAVKDGLLVIQALNSGTDFRLDRGALEQFEQGSRQIIDATARLGAQAAAIPPGDIAALTSVTSAISAEAEALIRLAAVPFGNLGNTAAAFGRVGDGGGGVTIMPGAIQITAAPGMNVERLADAVMQKIQRNIAGRR